jgi:hypothetical protein
VHDHFTTSLGRILSKYYKNKIKSIQEECDLRIDKQGGIDLFIDEIRTLFDLDDSETYHSSDDSDYEHYGKYSKIKYINSQKSKKSDQVGS